jgi:hypothetical protein
VMSSMNATPPTSSSSRADLLMAACAPVSVMCPCRGDQHQGGLVQHLLSSSLRSICCLPADVPTQVLPKKEAVVTRQPQS